MMKQEEEKKKNAQCNNSPFAVPVNSQLFGYYQWCEVQRRFNRKNWRNIPIINKSNKVCPIVKKERRAIPVVGPMAITDIDAGYFTDLAGRPIREKISRHRYVEQLRKVLRTELLIGYNRDDCLRIDQQFIDEKKQLAAIERQYRQYNSAFEEYLSTDHKATMKIFDEAHKELQKSNNLVEKRDELLNKFGQVRLEVYQWEEMWRVAKMCHEFFRKLTSESLQLPINEPKSEKNRKSSQRASVLGTLEHLVEAFERDISEDCLGSEEISLKDPHELSRIFAAIEQRNLDALIHFESLAGPIAEMTTSIVTAEELIGGEIRLIEESLDELKSLINVSEQRATELETYADYLLHEVFRELVCSESTLHLRVFIEDTYESCVGPNDVSLDSYSMMQVIEKTYESLNMTLDSLPREIVKVCEKEGFAQEMRRMQEAEDAARKFDLMHRLLAALERIMETPNSNTKLKSKSMAQSSVLKLASSVPAVVSRLKNYQKSFVPLKKFNLFFNDNCQPTDSDILSELTVKMQKVIAHEETSPGNDDQEDCRDEISNIA